MAEPTTEERELIDRFRDNLKDVLKKDEHMEPSFLIRWIRARDHNLKKAEEMLRAHLKWREERDVDNVLNKPFDSFFLDNFPWFTDTVDKNGHVILDLPIGTWDLRKMIDRQDDFYVYICRMFESVLDQIKKRNMNLKPGEWPQTQMTVIQDFKGFSYAQMVHVKAMQNFIKMASTYEGHYPELLYQCYYINGPKILPGIMSMLQNVLAPKTLGKIACISDPKKWQPLLLEVVGEDQLSRTHGGKIVRIAGGKELLEMPTCEDDE
jgi:hypothetical protein